jgi:hypothetical protein
VDGNKRPSQYLVKRAEALIEVLRFYGEGDQSRPMTERHLCFLAQLEFWTWEMDSLIMAFANFSDRSAAWGTIDQMLEHLRQEGIAVNAQSLIKTKSSRRTRAAIKPSVQVVAPLELLTTAVQAWNDLLEKCEKHFQQNVQYSIEELGAQLIADLSTYRRTVPGGKVQAPT